MIFFFENLTQFKLIKGLFYTILLELFPAYKIQMLMTTFNLISFKHQIRVNIVQSRKFKKINIL